MNKEEILERSRKENRNQDIAELEVISRSGNIAMRVGLILCAIFSLIEVIIKDNINSSAWAIYFGMLTALFIYKYVKMGKNTS